MLEDEMCNVLSYATTFGLTFLIFTSSYIYLFTHAFISGSIGPGPRESGAPSSWSSGCGPDPKTSGPPRARALVDDEKKNVGSWQRQGLPTHRLK